MSRLKRWDKFARDHLDPPPSRRVGRRWVENGEIEGQIIDGDVWVDMDAWRTRQPIPDEIDELLCPRA